MFEIESNPLRLQFHLLCIHILILSPQYHLYLSGDKHFSNGFLESSGITSSCFCWTGYSCPWCHPTSSVKARPRLWLFLVVLLGSSWAWELWDVNLNCLLQNPCDDQRHLEIWSEKKSCSRLPDFLVVGPQKTGFYFFSPPGIACWRAVCLLIDQLSQNVLDRSSLNFQDMYAYRLS